MSNLIYQIVERNLIINIDFWKLNLKKLMKLLQNLLVWTLNNYVLISEYF